MKAVLELKRDKVGEIFYRYNVNGTLVWFSQYTESGNIYTVSVSAADDIKEDFRFYVVDGSQHEYYYPEFVEINTNHERLTVDKVDEYISGLMYAKNVAMAIMEIFESGEHKELYDKCHNGL